MAKSNGVIENLTALTDKLRKRAAQARQDGEASVSVGYTAQYALWVHERRAMKWRGFPRDRSVRKDKEGIARTGHGSAKGKHGLFWGPAGRAGFLLDVAREMQQELARIVGTAMQRGVRMAQSLLLAGLRLQRESQRNVPVEYGNLRASAFTRLE